MRGSSSPGAWRRCSSPACRWTGPRGTPWGGSPGRSWSPPIPRRRRFRRRTCRCSLEHQGEWGNSHTYLAAVPESGLGVALVINGNDTAAPSRLKSIDTNLLRILHGHSPVPAVVFEDWLQRYSWAVALGLLLVEVLSLWLSLRFLLRRRAAFRTRWVPLAWGAAALALDGFALWLCLVYAPARFDTHLSVIVRQFPDVGISLVPILALAIVWPIPRTVWLLATLWTGSRPPVARSAPAPVQAPANPA